jgi:YbbR domain-containing protein
MASLLSRLTNNWRLKLAAVALAVLLWVVLSADQITSQWLPVPVEVQVRDPGYELTDGPIPDQVDVRFSGPRQRLWELAVDRPSLVLRVADVGDNQVFILEPSMVRIPSGLTGVAAQDVRPSSIRLAFARIETRDVPVALQVSRGPREAHVLADTLRVQPSRIRVTGPAQRVGAIDVVNTRPLDLSREDSVFTRSVALDTTGLSGLQLSTSEVQVSGRVDPLAGRVITGVPVVAPGGASVVPNEVQVHLHGPESVVQGLNAARLRVSIPPDAIPAQIPFTGVVLPVRAESVPAGIEVRVVPETVRVMPAPVRAEVLPSPADGPTRDTLPREQPPPRDR